MFDAVGVVALSCLVGVRMELELAFSISRSARMSQPSFGPGFVGTTPNEKRAAMSGPQGISRNSEDRFSERECDRSIIERLQDTAPAMSSDRSPQAIARIARLYAKFAPQERHCVGMDVARRQIGKPKVARHAAIAAGFAQAACLAKPP